MANYSVWNVRLRHEWLATPLKKKRVKRRQAVRIGLADALARKGKGPTEEAEPEAPETDVNAPKKSED